jgi:hypothetical protein
MRKILEKWSLNGDYMPGFFSEKQKIKLNNDELP